MIMLKIKVICIGTLKEKYWRDACFEYAKRLGAFCKFEIIELAESRVPEKPSEKEIAAALSKEASLILKNLSGAVYTLCIEGKPMSSEKLAECIERDSMTASELCFVIGSSHGLSNEIKSAGKRISMSEMTFPHQLARVMLCEQIYRAMSIINGGKYHK